jgi:GNAT superfamily N-acetyltransferase
MSHLVNAQTTTTAEPSGANPVTAMPATPMPAIRPPASVCRPATAADIPALLALYQQLRPQDPALPAAFNCESVLNHPATEILLCCVEGQIAASCQLAVIPTLTNAGRPFAVLEHVITAEAFRRRGLARQLLQYAINKAQQRQCYKALLLSGAKRPAAHQLYQQLGFNGDVERGFVLKLAALPTV